MALARPESWFGRSLSQALKSSSGKVEAGRLSPGKFGRDHTLEVGVRIDRVTTLRDGDVVALGPVSIV